MMRGMRVIVWLSLAAVGVNCTRHAHLLHALHSTAAHAQACSSEMMAIAHPKTLQMCFPELQVASSVKRMEANTKVYQPNSFAKIRNHFGICESEYAAALNPSNLVPYNSNSKSGQAFWRSSCGKFFIKTQSHADSKIMRSILPRYVDRICGGTSNEERLLGQEQYSFLCPILGIYRIHLQDSGYFPFLQQKGYTYLVVMKALDEQLPPGLTYDIKGSLTGRKGDNQLLKDQDFIANKERFVLSAEQQEIFMNTLREDVEFLAKGGLMDYSLLVGVRPTELAWSDILGMFKVVVRKLAPISMRSKDDRFYTFMLIDYLQRYTLRKRFETFLKSLFYGRKNISAVPPREYGKRFLKTFQDKMVLLE